eukprot:comp20335_c0_seq1/m.25608 comp20335_c0_seq1/g.25608  ORF comp20335_c0_seq1/g.25608 comp20335_c0_seq1/m.25608 type:complete len:760 (-) comp20335_c0_seq1:14-2293(-)
MKAQTLEISWHAKEPILSVDFCGDRLATAGADNDVKMWRIEGGAGAEPPKVTFLSNLSRHSKAVNVVRFSPNGQYLASASDDSAVIVWKLGPHRTGQSLGEDEETEQVETWQVVHMMRTHEEDVYDLAWSPDSRYLASASVDNTVHIWDVSRGKSVQHIKDHKHYVQGVAWDPRGEFLATQSSDRSCRIYSLKAANGKKGANSKENTVNDPKQPVNFRSIYANSKLEIPAGSSSAGATGTGVGASEEERKSESGEEGGEGGKTEKTEGGLMGPPPTRQYRMYTDETVQSFFRRLAFTPDGSLLLSPAGLAYVGSEGDHGYQSDSITKIGSDSFVNTTFVYARPSLNKPALHFGGLRKPSVVVRCNPVLFELRKNPAAAAGTGVEGKASGDVSLVGLPYRMVVAVGTLDAVLLYDTQQATPFAYLANLHYAPLTDMAWSNDGRTLALSSQDGYVSMVEFASGELGVPIPTEAYPEHMQFHEDSQTPPIPFASAESTPVKTPAEIPEPRIKKAKLEPVAEPQTPISIGKKDPPSATATETANGSPPPTINLTGDSPPGAVAAPAVPAPSGKAKLNFMKKPANPPATAATTTTTTTPPGGDSKGVKRANLETVESDRLVTPTEQKPTPRRIAPTLLTPVATPTEKTPKAEGVQGDVPSAPAPKRVCRITPTLISSDLSNPVPTSTLLTPTGNATTNTAVSPNPSSTEGSKENSARTETSGDENVQPRRIAPTLISSPKPCAGDEKPTPRRITPTLLTRSANT